MRKLACACAALFVTAGSAGADSMPADLAQALAPAGGPTYSYGLEFATPDFTARGRIDPTKPSGARVRVDHPPRASWPDEFAETVAEVDREADGNIWCARAAEMIGGDITRVSGTDRQAVYQFAPRAPRGAEREEREMMARLAGRITIARAPAEGETWGPWRVAAMRLSLRAPFRPNLLVRVDRLDISMQCAVGPDGRAYRAVETSRAAGSALGQVFDETTTTRISALAPAN